MDAKNDTYTLINVSMSVYIPLYFSFFVVVSNEKEIGVKCENDLCIHSNGRIYLEAIVVPIWMRWY